MLQNKKAVLFDLDGTLADSMWVWTHIDEEYGKIHHIDFHETFHEEIEGKSFVETAVYFRDRFHLDKTVEQIMKEWNQMALDAYENLVPLKPGAEAFLEHLYKAGIKTAICTSNSRMLVEALCRSKPVLQRIDVILTSDEIHAGKPAPDIYLQAAEMLDVLPSCCLVFEDVPQGILAGQNAGMDVCAVEDDFSRNLFSQKRQLARYYIKDYQQVLQHTYEVLKQ